MGNGASLSLHHIGQCNFSSPFHSKLLSLTQLVHVFLITKNLISISKFVKDNKVYIEFYIDLCFVKDQVSQAI